ncbi:multidrug efflux SMR transporter [Leuconostoc lactis]|uniref:Multidrug efflux SMR transporter n=1 Tax=Leuconostoc lactis TaxID=1246 RepID=A0AAP9ECM5_LEULA|nr:multidrug efflux SMR transporter [Leuconostoc lactis]MBU7538233.1 multidrug efflux SMR transporter [Leuconostoc lactis]MCC2744370.1 multidrug efflux SMR transporter [Leuconostoc lactis]MCC2754908.1 multidrug efflux SMR transporter [Leuconostoc lactis]MDI6496762.1 multidrug efflux SMR transporter [Leuconostoc lactis]MDI6574037.1 multidrug efflux SMR transporter [Leuconostoc lactis]
MSWIYLLLAGLSEILWATTMKLSQGFTKVGWVIVTIIGLIASMAFLIQAVKQLPFSLAYPIWTGIGAVGSVVMGVVLFRDQFPPVTWFFIGLLIVAIIGIKITAGE